MVSIEREIDDKDRFEFNRPFAAIELKFGESSEILPELAWTQKTITWLDYDDPLELSMLDDLALCVRNMPSGSIILISSSAHPNSKLDERVDDLRNRLDTYAPAQVTANQLGGWSLAGIYRDIIDERIRTAIRERNTLKDNELKVHYQQIFNFQYADGVKMLTVGGIILNESDETGYRACAFDKFDFHRSDNDAYRINVPKLTPKEIRHLDSFLPSENEINATDVGIPQSQSARYAALYRYFPRYVDADL